MSLELGKLSRLVEQKDMQGICDWVDDVVASRVYTLEAEKAKLREALRVYAAYHGQLADHHRDDCPTSGGCERCRVDAIIDEFCAAGRVYEELNTRRLADRAEHAEKDRDHFLELFEAEREERAKVERWYVDQREARNELQKERDELRNKLAQAQSCVDGLFAKLAAAENERDGMRAIMKTAAVEISELKAKLGEP